MINLKAKIKSIALPDGQIVYIKQFSVRLRQAHLMGSQNDENFHAKLIAFSICDAEGNLLYGPDDLEQFLDLPCVVADPIIKEILILNGLQVEKKDS